MKEHISAIQPRTLPKPAGFSYGYEVKQGRLVFISGQVARDENNAVVGKGGSSDHHCDGLPTRSYDGADRHPAWA